MASCGLPTEDKTFFSDSDSIETWQVDNWAMYKDITLTDGKSKDIIKITDTKFHSPRYRNRIPETMGWIEDNHDNKSNLSCCFVLTHFAKGRKYSMDGCLFIRKEDDRRPAMVEFYCEGIFYHQRINTLIYIKEETSGLNDCIEITNNEPNDCKDKIKLKSVIWSKSKGLVSYQIEESDSTTKLYQRNL